MRRLLLLDADNDQHAIVGSYFRHFGYEVDHARSIEDGLRHAAAYPPDVIVTDWHLPDAPDGAGVRILAAQLLGSRPLLVCSTDVFARRRYGDTYPHVRKWLTKPCTPSDLFREVQKIIQEGPDT